MDNISRNVISVVVNATVHVAGDLVAFDDVLADIGAIRAGHTFPSCDRVYSDPDHTHENGVAYIKANAVERILFDANPLVGIRHERNYISIAERFQLERIFSCRI